MKCEIKARYAYLLREAMRTRCQVYLDSR